MARASFSKCTGFSLAFARGLWRWLPVAARLDLRSALRWQCALAADSRQDLLRMATSAWGEKTLRVSASIYKSTFYIQDDPSIREEVLDSRLGGSVPHVLRFFLRILRDNLARTSDRPSARVCNST
jgi:hypothetical protein